MLNTVITSEFVSPFKRPRLMRWVGVEIPDDVVVMAGARFQPGHVRFGNRAWVNRRCFFDPGDSYIDIHEDVGLAADCVITADGHHIGSGRRRAAGHDAKPVVIERGCWLGTKVTVLPGVTIGEGCVIGAGSVVTKSTEPNGVYVGAPARRIRDLSEAGDMVAVKTVADELVETGDLD
jgi:maltose O-acetyltransferase